MLRRWNGDATFVSATSLIVLEVPAEGLPAGVDPAVPVFPGDCGAARIGADVLHDAISRCARVSRPRTLADRRSPSRDAMETCGPAGGTVGRPATTLPQLAPAPFAAVHKIGGNAFHGADFRFQLVVLQAANRQMAMIGHDDKRADLIPHFVEVQDRPPQLGGILRSPKPAGAMAGVHPPFNLAKNCLSVFRPGRFTARRRVLEFPLTAHRDKFVFPGGGQCIGQVKGDKVGCARLTPMREVARVDFHRPMWVEPTKARRRVEVECHARHRSMAVAWS